MRFELDLYINLRPCLLLDDRLSPLKGKGRSELRFTVFRENTEGLYTGIGGVFKKGTADEVAQEEEINTRKGVERIVERRLRSSPDSAGSRRVCMADKANVLLRGHGLWRRVFAEVARRHPGIEAKARLRGRAGDGAGAASPRRYEVIVTNNLFGDILTDLGAALTGGLGLAASGNIHPGHVSLFEPVHGSAPDIAGQGHGQSARDGAVRGAHARAPGALARGAPPRAGGEDQVRRDRARRTWCRCSADPRRAPRRSARSCSAGLRSFADVEGMNRAGAAMCQARCAPARAGSRPGRELVMLRALFRSPP